MRAAVMTRPGGPEVIVVAQVPEPAPPVRDEIVVRVAASSVNGTDLGLRRGDARLALLGRLPLVLGFDLAGTVEQCGPAVTAFGPGDQVMALLGHGGGALAERVVVRQSRAARVPRTASLAEAAALPLAGLTALQALHGQAQLGRWTGSGRTPRVLINGASGGIGSYAVQLAKLAGAHVTAVASGPKLGFVAQLGADELVDYRSTEVTALDGRWDVVLDAPGRLRFTAVRCLLTDDGVLVSTFPIGPDVRYALAPGLLRRGPGRRAGVMTSARPQDLAHLAALVDDGRLRIPVTRTFPLDQVAAAHRHAEGPATGKVVITLAST